jgi:hypothetical protein
VVRLYATDGAWEERRYSSFSFLTSALKGGEWSASRPGRAGKHKKKEKYLVILERRVLEITKLHSVRIQVLMAANVKMTVLRFVPTRSLIHVCDVSEVLTVSIIRVMISVRNNCGFWHNI